MSYPLAIWWRWSKFHVRVHKTAICSPLEGLTGLCLQKSTNCENFTILQEQWSHIQRGVKIKQLAKIVCASKEGTGRSQGWCSYVKPHRDREVGSELTWQNVKPSYHETIDQQWYQVISPDILSLAEKSHWLMIVPLHSPQCEHGSIFTSDAWDWWQGPREACIIINNNSSNYNDNNNDNNNDNKNNNDNNNNNNDNDNKRTSQVSFLNCLPCS